MNTEEKKLIDELLYCEISEVMEQICRLDSPELIHAYVCFFNWNDDIGLMFVLLESPHCSIVTAKEMLIWQMEIITYKIRKSNMRMIGNMLLW